MKRCHCIRQFALTMVAYCLVIALGSSAVAEAPATAFPSLAEIDNRLQTVQTTSVLSEQEKHTLIGYLEQTRQALQARNEYQNQARAYSEVLLTAADTTRALENRIADFKPATMPDAARLSSDALQIARAEQLLSLSKWKNRAADIEAEIREEFRVDIAALADETRERYEVVMQRTVNEQSMHARSAATEAQAAEQAMLRARIDMLDQRLFSRRQRLDILRKELELLLLKIADSEEQIAKLSTSEFGRNLANAQELVAQAEKNRESAAAYSREVQVQAEHNVRLATELRELIGKREALAERASIIEKRIGRASDLLTGLTEQLERQRLPLSPEFGAALLRQRAQLKTEPLTAAEEDDIERELALLQLRQFELFEESLELWPGEDHPVLLDAAGESDTQQLADELSRQRRKLIDWLKAEYAQYDAQLMAIDDQAQRLTGLAEAYTKRVDRHLLWNQSAELFGMTTLLGVTDPLVQEITGKNIPPSLSAFLRLYAQRPLISSFTLLLVAGLFAFKRRLVLRLKEMRARVGRVQLDKVTLTLRAVFITFLLALPIPILLATPGLLSLTVADAGSQLSPAFLLSALLYLGFEFFRQSLREDGLAELHFRWPAKQLYLVRRKLRLMMPMFLLPAIAGIVVHYLAGPDTNASVGRICFVVAALVFAGFSMRISRSSAHDIPAGTGLHRPLYQYGMLVFCIILPVVFAVLTLLGYQYTAEVLGTRLLTSLGIFVGYLLVFNLALRAVAVRERQLALKRVRAKRAATPRVDAATEAGSISLESDEIDLRTVSGHSRTLIKLLVSIVFAFSIWPVWSDLLVAFESLQSLTLWHIESEIGGVVTVENVTLWHLLAAGLALLITYLGVKNIPGTLEVLILSRLSLATGTSYAITTMVTYAIVITGVITALQLIGAQWSKLQWLVAALGVGLGFGLQEIVANFVSGVLILFERPIRLGDTITLGDQSGIVTRIRIRATTIMNWDRKEILIPNKAFITERLVNWTLTDPVMRLIIPIGVAYGSDVELVEKILYEVARDNSRVLKDPASTVLFHDFGDSSLGFELRVFVRGIHDLIPARHELHKAIESGFRRQGVEISFPQRDIHFDPGPLEISIVDSSRPGHPDTAT